MRPIGILSVVMMLVALIVPSREQRIMTIQLDGVQYFVSRMNPYSPELNFFLAYQYCRSLGLQLVSFETREKADSITQYLSNAGYTKYDFWTSGNKLGTDMFLWMSTGLPFNATFDYMKRPADMTAASMSSSEILSGSTAPQRTARDSGDSGSSDGCVALKAPHLEWATDDCTAVKDFICEQTRCYYYNYGSIPVSSAQGRSSLATSTATPSTSLVSAVVTDNAIGIKDFIHKIRPGLRPIKPEDQTDLGTDSKLEIASDNDSAAPEPEQSTNGPYDVNVQMHDDPMVDSHDQMHEEDHYVSTVEPDAPTSRSVVSSDGTFDSIL